MTWVSWRRVLQGFEHFATGGIPRPGHHTRPHHPEHLPLAESSVLFERQTAIMVYVRQEKLPNLKQYKYSGVDHSLLSRYVMKPFYTNVVIKCFPMSMAPNLITLSGFTFVVVNLLTLLWYNPTLDQDCPPWVYASWAVGLFLYQTFDAVDGSQA
jgi:CDP-alcohol phosphatidyltransferase